jgi:Na+/H+ antiporter NhaD/arsenite permease-like protein
MMTAYESGFGDVAKAGSRGAAPKFFLISALIEISLLPWHRTEVASIVPMDFTTLFVFILVYLGMLLGRIPGLALDRTGVALLGALVLVASGRIETARVFDAVDVPTIALLFGLMVVSAQFRMSGFYSHIVRRIGVIRTSPTLLLAIVIAVVGVLSALLANDIVCLAIAPVLIDGCAKRRLDPKPYLLALACAANVGSAATLIGNPQNILVGQVLGLSFSKYLLDASVPAVVGLVVVWLVISRLHFNRWISEGHPAGVKAPRLSRWQTLKGMLILGGLVALFLFTSWPREVLALGAAALLLCSRSMRSREMLGIVDWQLLTLFISLFLVNFAVNEIGLFAQLEASLAAGGVDVRQPVWLFVISTVLSNLVSNVPAVMFLLPSATHPMAGAILALSSTLAGNLIVVGSIANIIVIDQAERSGIPISWREHARVGVPVTLLTLGMAAAWLWVIA